MKKTIVVSACLLGENCKYNGKNNLTEGVLKLKEKYNVCPVCPECLGGLKIPREPSEIKGGGVFSKSGEERTLQYKKGAERALKIAKEAGAKAAVMKERSPSCGCGQVYDGSFTHTLVKGNGVTAELFLQNGIRVFGESEVKEAVKFLEKDEGEEN